MVISKDKARSVIETLYQGILADERNKMKENINNYLKGFGDKIITFDTVEEIQGDYIEFIENSDAEVGSPFLTVVGDEIYLRNI
ncbi:MAG: hypothetical protein A2268_02970 [Candidatus Raymondbacteria bacterium RifOxyA12_full_50_37]|uniref:Uncharacterized protein n=1 Tax=Candidatus Raymondbacteria bacterium RIFOXYD12_FULL_49_13 TaxID=1817890 RepID=A0A1F7F901_UNCRA|nr:MAG: hypothetical protein A2248_17075 [Candidatus Raymondbacteria bacterium RIFOXYA2_FULL_49_16]OGJ90739.1 MAG: hypothetical protein A2268_02970 [Candidatus Raymondbacteria bacterium RifOxyA12_full_50_37]OGJ91716.1 MAG: hypothetical protein A2350_00380 [Candidatus Raymondbacteria bacterium RifOxyB12_full_50_8]OGJ98376.1 MAG: hypothetical protein A2453_08980 [Candidatus Raymondbacteria bacterium RIFOXYC2_FULL_50_21]OGK03101.1 MAG: hypothetical protein A2519_06810 [Candidatus Raymondbacteria b